MSKISKSIVISEFLWLLFFAVVFLKFDYTRTTLAVVNAIVWLCIVLVFSIIILQFLTRQAFTKVRGILLVLIFLIIDQVIKALLYFAPSEISIPVIPNILSILVILNKYQTLVLQAADKFASPYIVACAKLLLLPFFLLLLYLLSKSKNRFNFKTPRRRCSHICFGWYCRTWDKSPAQRQPSLLLESVFSAAALSGCSAFRYLHSALDCAIFCCYDRNGYLCLGSFPCQRSGPLSFFATHADLFS